MRELSLRARCRRHGDHLDGRETHGQRKDVAFVARVKMAGYVLLRRDFEQSEDLFIRCARRIVDAEANTDRAFRDGSRRQLLHFLDLRTVGWRESVVDTDGFAQSAVADSDAIIHERPDFSNSET